LTQACGSGKTRPSAEYDSSLVATGVAREGVANARATMLATSQPIDTPAKGRRLTAFRALPEPSIFKPGVRRGPCREATPAGFSVELVGVGPTNSTVGGE
jgi:hypothetical protein